MKSRGETRFETLKDVPLCKTLICEDNSLLNQSGVCSHYKPKGSIYKISTTLCVVNYAFDNKSMVEIGITLKFILENEQLKIVI